MNSEIYCAQISAGLARMVVEVRQNIGVNALSNLIHAEEFIREFFNCLYGWRLRNVNVTNPNARGIDLLDPENHVVVQVSADTSHNKIQGSIDKSSDYAGSHFLFVALTDRLPKYQAPFDRHGLVFNPDTDILDASHLYALAAHCEGWERYAAVDILRELSALVQKYYPASEPQQRLPLRLLGRGRASNIFLYNSNVVPLMGRDRELKTLLEFVTGDQTLSFRWWGVTAPGGAGKTRLAYELQNRLLADGSWDVGILPNAVLTEDEAKVDELLEAFSGPTLLLADYVQQKIPALKVLIERLSDPDLDRLAPMRLLLLERDIRDENGQIFWWKKLRENNHHVRGTCHEELPLTLKPLSAEDGFPDPLELLIRAFADRLCSEAAQKKEAFHPLPEGREAYLRRRLSDIDPELVRPLFAMILTDAWVRNPETETWSRERLLSQLVDREWSLVACQLQPYHNNGSTILTGACRNLWLTATVLGTGTSNLTLERLQALLPKDCAYLSHAVADHVEELESRTLSPEEVLLTRAGLLENGTLRPLRPDLLGEYFILESLKEMGKDEKQAFYEALMKEDVLMPYAAIFFARLLFDYERVLDENAALWEALFPADLNLNGNLLIRYCMLLRILFTYSFTSAIRKQIAHRLEEYIEINKSSTWEAGVALDSLAVVRMEMGDYSTALKLFEKAINITESVREPEHPDVATLYNNIASLYRAMGYFKKALKYHEKAQEIREAVLGSNHPDLATTYNNIGLIHHDIGDYPRALMFLRKAKRIREAVLGQSDPETAMTYNNIGSVYLDMRDYPKALDYFEKARMIMELECGTEHPDTAMAYNNIGTTYYNMKVFPKALEFFEKSLKIREKTYGQDHPDTARTCNNIANVYDAIGDYKNALDCFEKARKAQEAVLGPQHPDTAMTWNNLAVLYFKSHDLEHAIHYSNQATDVCLRALGPDHPNTISICKTNVLLKQIYACQ